MSKYQVEYMAKRRKQWKSDGLCTGCGAQPTIGPRGGKGYCDRCRELARVRAKKQFDNISEHTKRRRRERLSDGLCVYCGKPVTNPRYKSTRWCNDCRERANKVRDYSKNKFYRMATKADAIRIYGGCCEQCGHSNPAVLMFHHINGDGKDDRASGRSKDVLIRDIATNGRQDDIQLLCANCHYAIHWGDEDWAFHLP